MKQKDYVYASKFAAKAYELSGSDNDKKRSEGLKTEN
jgi:hypothetical protein